MESNTSTRPSFLEGTEVASRPRQPGFEEQLPLLERDLELKKKLMIALVVIFSVFAAAMQIGAAVGVFI